MMADDFAIASIPKAPLPRVHLAYEQSSQARKWHFTRAQLAQIRQASSDAAKAKALKAWQDEEAALLPEGVKAEAQSTTTAAQVEAELPSLDEQQSLIIFYALKIPGLTRAFKLPELVEATATTYMKRFYLRNTCLEYHPKDVMLTCIFLATKTENCPIALSSFSQRIAGKNATPAAVEEIRRAIVALEFPISQALAFEFSVQGVHRALTGLLLDIAAQQAGEGVVPKSADEALAKEARQHASTSRLTDAELLFAPSQIAYASLRRSSAKGKEVAHQWFDGLQKRAEAAKRTAREERQRWKEAHAPKSKTPASGQNAGTDATTAAADEAESGPALGISLEELDRVADQAIALMEDMEKRKGGITADAVKDIDRRLKLCKDPAKVPGTKLFTKAHAQREAAAAQRRKRKAESVAASKTASGLADPFADDGKSGVKGGLFGATAKKQKIVDDEEE